MKKTFQLIAMTLMLISLVQLQTRGQEKADSILGKWTNTEKTRMLEFVKAGSSYEAIVREAPDPSFIGKKQITNIKYKNGSYQGSLYLPKRGKSYPCKLTINAKGELVLSVKAGMISQSQTWSRPQ